MIGAIQHDAEDAIPAHRLHRLVDCRERRLARLHHQQHRIDQRGQQVRVGQQRHRRRVDDDPVEARARFVSTRRMRSDDSTLIGSRSGSPARENRQVVNRTAAASWRSSGPATRRSIRSCSAPGTSRGSRAAQVGVNQQDLTLVDSLSVSARLADVSVLPSPGMRAGDHHHLGAVLAPATCRRGGQPAVLLDGARVAGTEYELLGHGLTADPRPRRRPAAAHDQAVGWRPRAACSGPSARVAPPASSRPGSRGAPASP